MDEKRCAEIDEREPLEIYTNSKIYNLSEKKEWYCNDINTNLYGPARGSNPRNKYDAALYFFNCNSSTTSTYNFGLY